MAMQPEELKALRQSLRLTQDAFGDLIGVSRVTVGQMERGAAPITDRTEKLVNALLASGAVDRQIVDAAAQALIDRLRAALDDPDTVEITLPREEAALALGLLKGLNAINAD